MKIKNILIAGLLFAPLYNLRTASDPKRLEKAARMRTLQEAQRKIEAAKKAAQVKTQRTRPDESGPAVWATPRVSSKTVSDLTPEEEFEYVMALSKRDLQQPSAALAFDEPAEMMASKPLSAIGSSAAPRTETAQSVQQSLSPLGDSFLVPNNPSVQATGVYAPPVARYQGPVTVVPAVAPQVPAVAPQVPAVMQGQETLRSADEELAFALQEFDRIGEELNHVKKLLKSLSKQAASETQPDVPSLPGTLLKLQPAMTYQEEGEAMARLMTETATQAEESKRRQETEEREFELAKTQSEIAALVEAEDALLKILVKSEKDEQKLQELREKLLIARAKLMSLRPIEVDMGQSYIF